MRAAELDGASAMRRVAQGLRGVEGEWVGEVERGWSPHEESTGREGEIWRWDYWGGEFCLSASY
jgi:hypothetical protein